MRVRQNLAYQTKERSMRSFGKHCIVYAISALLAAPISLVPTVAQAATDGYIYKGGTIYTMSDSMAEAKDPDHKAITAEIVITKGGKIIYVGAEVDAPEAELATKATIDLDGRTMLPGFIDPHGHFPGFASTDLYGVNLFPTPIGSCDTLVELVARLKASAEAIGGTATVAAPVVIFGNGYDDGLLKDIRRHPTAKELDGASTTQYVRIGHISGHMSVVNTLLATAISTQADMVEASTALRARQNTAGYPVAAGDREDIIKAIRIGKDTQGTYQYYITRTTDTEEKAVAGVEFTADGNLTGLLLEKAANLAINYFPDNKTLNLPAKQKAAREANITTYASQTYAAAGVTTANQSYTRPSAAILPYRELIKKGALGIRVVLNPITMDADFMGLTARKQLAWKESGGESGADSFNEVSRIAEDDPTVVDETRVVGDDLTLWYTGKVSGGTPTDAISPTLITVAADADLLSATGFADTAAVTAFGAAYPYRLILGTYKIGYDGSNQGYTGLFKVPGYYDLGTNTPYDPAFGAATTGLATDPIPVGAIPTWPLDSSQLYGLSGSLSMSPARLNALVNLYHAEAQGLTIHANGSLGNEHTVVAIEKAVEKAGDAVKDTRHTIIHAQMQERQQTQRLAGNYSDIEAQIAGTLPVFYENLEGYGDPDYTDGTDPNSADERRIMAKLMRNQNIVSSYYVDHTYYWGARHRDIYMGPGRANQISPLGWAVEYDHYYTSHNDTPIVPILPLRTLEAAVTRVPFDETAPLSGSSKDINATVDLKGLKDDITTTTFWDYDQRVNVLQALRALTIYSAFSNKADTLIGSIATGKYADFVILDEDPFVVGVKNPDQLANIRITTTIVADKPVYGVLPGGETFASVPKASFVQKSDNLVVTMDPAKTKQLTAADEEGFKGLAAGEKSYGAHEFVAVVTLADGTSKPTVGEKEVVFQLDIVGNGAAVSTFALNKLVDANTSKPYDLLTDAVVFENGKFWISEPATPRTPLKADAILAMNQYYTVHFIIEDDNANYDTAHAIAGTIEDPLRLTTTGGLPTNLSKVADPDTGGSSSSGCAVGATANYDLLLLLFALMGAVAFRAARSRGRKA